MGDLSDRGAPAGTAEPRLLVIPPALVRRSRTLPVVRDLFVTSAGFYPATRRHRVDRPGGHGELILLYCVHGAGWCRLGEREWRLREGCALIITPGTPHTYAATNDDPWAVWWVHFGGERVNAYLEALRLSPDEPLLYAPDREAITAAFQELCAEFHHGCADAALLALSTALARLLGRLATHRRSPHTRGRKGEEKILQSIRLMEQRLGETLRLGELARAAGLSTPHYSALFRKLTGTSPARYFAGLKMRRACELLDLTDEPVGEIARSLGYDDPFHFSRVFKRVIGASPSRYRAMVRG